MLSMGKGFLLGFCVLLNSLIHKICCWQAALWETVGNK